MFPNCGCQSKSLKKLRVTHHFYEYLCKWNILEVPLCTSNLVTLLSATKIISPCTAAAQPLRNDSITQNSIF